MSLMRKLGLICCLFGLVACGNSKSGYDSGPVPNIGKRQRPIPDKDTLKLKTESLKLTHFTQTWKLNALTQDDGAEKYLRLQKVFPFPIQFNGWVTLDNVEQDVVKCADTSGEVPEFFLDDDHNGITALRVGEKVAVNLEKLYEIRVELPNSGLCKGVGMQFGVLYGTKE